jgi:hypothetical protein
MAGRRRQRRNPEAEQARRYGPETYEAYKWFRQHGGVRPDAALALAMAEQAGDQEGLEVLWDYDDGECLDTYDPEVGMPPEGVEFLSAYVEDEEGNVIASLGCIEDPDPIYRRIVEAELLHEALSELGFSLNPRRCRR